MRRWHFYDRQTGLFVGRSFSAATDRDLGVNTPDGCAAIEGAVDHLSQRVDLQTGEVIHDPDLAAANVARTDAAHARARKSQRIAELDLLQIRSISALIDNPADAEARANFNRRKAEIEQLRGDIIEKGPGSGGG